MELFARTVNSCFILHVCIHRVLNAPLLKTILANIRMKTGMQYSLKLADTVGAKKTVR